MMASISEIHDHDTWERTSLGRFNLRRSSWRRKDEFTWWVVGERNDGNILCILLGKDIERGGLAMGV
jgi:hypothetical protein